MLLLCASWVRSVHPEFSPGLSHPSTQSEASTHTQPYEAKSNCGTRFLGTSSQSHSPADLEPGPFEKIPTSWTSGSRSCSCSASGDCRHEQLSSNCWHAVSPCILVVILLSVSLDGVPSSLFSSAGIRGSSKLTHLGSVLIKMFDAGALGTNETLTVLLYGTELTPKC